MRSAETGRTRDCRIHATEEIAKSLQGNWRPELLFIVRQQLEIYEAYQRQIAECDLQLREHLANLASALSTPVDGGNPPQSKKSKRNRYMPQFPLSNELMRISGVDLTQIDGVDAMSGQTLVSEVGLDMNRWNTESHFTSWLGPFPDDCINGDKVLSRGTLRVINSAATTLRIGASNLIRSKTYLGAQHRRLRTKLGAPKVITAMAYRLPRLVHRMLKYGQSMSTKVRKTTSSGAGSSNRLRKEERLLNSDFMSRLLNLAYPEWSFWFLGRSKLVTIYAKVMLKEFQLRNIHRLS